ncbi:putative zinc-binding metallopeptidase [Pedobacter sp. MC2016-14]|uniref:putative zinc-binding metallopeptidase n=1 Tax=Pedobacter sp. MC2016-14 TaxID=2897327 RepID=UPI001E2AE6C6|nr:putative zinc-binding metallopeptidase [Pedobacter sp. MC2016-14]MCD0488607.1 putative zinc-binding metallopeptidase [Pedobacter sp. MC2016-14]
MDKIKYTFGFLVLLTILAACKKEEVLTPSELAIEYQLPQGNHDYDNTLVELNNKYGSFFLYKFSAVDFGYTPVYAPSNFGDTYVADIADESYVGKVLTFVQKNWLSYYSDAFLKANLPFKVLLAQNMRSKTSASTKYAVLSNYNQMTLSYFGPDFDLLTAAQKKTYVNSMHTEFFNFIFNRGKIDIPADFGAVTSYTTAATATNYYALGYVSYVVALQADKLNKDFLSYIALITSKTKAELDATILSPTTDTAGLIRKKYDFIINYYKTKYNIDLQAIGNAGVVN